MKRNASLDRVKLALSPSFVSAVGHQGTADILSKMLNVPVQVNRTSIKLTPDDLLVVFQLNIRLAEGAVLSEQEVNSLLKEGKAQFDLVGLGPC